MNICMTHQRVMRLVSNGTMCIWWEVKQMDELLQNIQDFTDEIASTIRLAIWLQIMSENTLEVEDDTD